MQNKPVFLDVALSVFTSRIVDGNFFWTITMLRLNSSALLTIGAIGALFCAGCSSSSTPYAVNCEQCTTQPYYSVMLTQPGTASDFPVGYRVRIRENDPRLSKIKPLETVSVQVVTE